MSVGWGGSQFMGNRELTFPFVFPHGNEEGAITSWINELLIILPQSIPLSWALRSLWNFPEWMKPSVFLCLRHTSNHLCWRSRELPYSCKGCFPKSKTPFTYQGRGWGARNGPQGLTSTEFRFGMMKKFRRWMMGTSANHGGVLTASDRHTWRNG